MFKFIKKIFVVLLASIVNVSKHIKCVLKQSKMRDLTYFY